MSGFVDSLGDLLAEVWKWAAGATGTALLAWWGDKKLKWRERRKHKRSTQLAIEAMAASHPTLLAGIEELTCKLTGVCVRQDEAIATLEHQNKDLADIKAMQWGAMELDTTPRFVCDNEGRNRLTNTAYARLLRVGRDDLDGFGYRNFIDPSCTDYLPSFSRAAAEHRQFDYMLLLRRPDGTRFWARVRAIPYPEDAPPATHWMGTITFDREEPGHG